MAVFTSLKYASTRFLTPCRLRFWELALCKRVTWLFPSVQRCNLSNSSDSSIYHPTSGLERYKDLQRHFNRKLKATYQRFSKTPHYSLVYGRHHVYFIEGDGVYRIDNRQNEQKPEQVLDLGQFSQWGGGPEREQRVQWHIQRIRLSPQEKHLAATVKTYLREEPRCVVVKLKEGHSSSLDHPHVTLTLDNVYSFEWATDDVLFYTTLERLRCSKVFRLDLTRSGSRITSVFEETQPDVFVEVALSRDQQILSINCSSRTSSEVLLIDKSTQSLELRLIQPRQRELLYHVEHWNGQLIILTNTGPRKEYQVVQAPLSEPSIVSWVPLFVPAAGSVVKDMEVVGDYCVLTVRTPAGKSVLTVIPLTQSKQVYSVQLPPWACAIETNKPGLAEHHSALEFLISSPVHPPVQCCLYPEDGLVLSGAEGGGSPEVQGRFITSHLDARSKDGTLVPVTLFHAAPMECLKNAPLLAHVYGAYGRDLNMEFSPEKRLLLEQGWALAYCHIRGGGERGLSWYRQACSEGKHRGVEDLEACLLHLFTSGVSSPSLTALTACSAGAVPVGAMCNRHPHMLKAVTLRAPFLDVLGAMDDPNLPLTMEDREEWGDPVGNPSHRRAIASYCPVHNITPQKYPSMLLTAYSGDARAPLTGIIRYSEKIQRAVHTHFSMHRISEHERAPNIVLNVHPGANHLRPEDFDLAVEEAALELAFLYTELLLDPPRIPRKRKR